MGLEQNSVADFVKHSGGEGTGELKNFSVLDEMKGAMKLGKAESQGSLSKHGAAGDDGFSVGEASVSDGKTQVAFASKSADEVVRVGSKNDIKQDLSVSLGHASKTLEKIAGNFVSKYEQAKDKCDVSDKQSEGGFKHQLNRIFGKITES
jgi:hypothetical protein